MVHDLTHGRWRSALTGNPFLILVSPVLLYLSYQQARARLRGQTFRVPTGIAYGLVLGALVWMVLRNQMFWLLRPEAK